MKELKVRKPFPYGGKMRAKGERIHVANRHAIILIASGKAGTVVKERASGEYPTRHMTAEPAGSGRREPPKLSRKERRQQRREGYARSDMVAES